MLRKNLKTLAFVATVQLAGLVAFYLATSGGMRAVVLGEGAFVIGLSLLMCLNAAAEGTPRVRTQAVATTIILGLIVLPVNYGMILLASFGQAPSTAYATRFFLVGLLYAAAVIVSAIVARGFQLTDNAEQN